MDDVEAPTFDASTPQEQPEIPIRAAPVVSIPIQDVDVGASRIMQLPSFVFRRDVWMSIANKIFCNPVFIAILCGFFLSLSTLGPRFLNPSSNDYIPGLGWFWTTTQWLGACVSPVSLFAMGVWMYESRAKLFLVPIPTAGLFMLSKLVLMPLLMVGLALAFNLDDNAGRAAVLIAALPVSMASFTLASKFKVGEAILSENVVLGTILLLPTILIWNIAMDAIDLFPVTKAA
jgi:predicted permease